MYGLHLIALWAGIILSLVTLQACKADPGSTIGLKEIFIGRCFDYNVTKYFTVSGKVRSEPTCTEIWNNFKSAFAQKAPCDVSQHDYALFMKDIQQDIHEGKSMFWSGVFELAHQYNGGGTRYVTLEDTLLGYLANSLTWCGKPTPPGIDFNACPGWSDCPQEASESFWGAASAQFASEAKGEVTVMLDGSNPDRPAYRDSSFFAKYELPNLDSGKVHSVKVLLSHELSQPVVETCRSGSLLKLKSDIEKHGLAFQCEDDPEALVFLLCADDPDNSHCRLAIRHRKGHLKKFRKRLSKFNRKNGSF